MIQGDKPIKKFNWPIRVYYEDTDAGGVVFHSNYLNFFERARTEMLRAFGHEQDALRADYGIIFVVRSLQVDYLKPARFNDLLLVGARLTEAKKASLVFEQKITRGDDILCKGIFRIACLDANAMTPKAIPQHLFKTIEE
ncbi:MULTISPECIES: tol-pal system-associated acyl-CoA thioesterase [Methylomicrobium]|uniref:Tol-pal system-associated acyl-CoA thioesterase n=1 Tax=Methylomicrobium album BG8 TaxID=686340 RepID=H8GL25_METAL|nr:MULTISPECIES: tol-pal system-associated acyl-CoA thioesterase [Methylomicrobium]EIC30506.1 tol-pal system-associated acyl-CoA thioesterase [Methylomicrobium album BG8]